MSVLGLGDSRYNHFNVAARKLNRRIIQLGATEFWRMGLCDDRHDFGYEGEYDPWVEGLMLKVTHIWPMHDEIFPIEHEFPCRFEVTLLGLNDSRLLLTDTDTHTLTHTSKNTHTHTHTERVNDTANTELPGHTHAHIHTHTHTPLYM
eukprot:GHVR01009699.1.p1 GENE.GHVR01009699.1~~GHVR01009699.1.p1  ORF type:complete len:148 (-),score=70.06 GHVR01009699.1:46-489(-)